MFRKVRLSAAVGVLVLAASAPAQEHVAAPAPAVPHAAPGHPCATCDHGHGHGHRHRCSLRQICEWFFYPPDRTGQICGGCKPCATTCRPELYRYFLNEHPGCGAGSHGHHPVRHGAAHGPAPAVTRCAHAPEAPPPAPAAEPTPVHHAAPAPLQRQHCWCDGDAPRPRLLQQVSRPLPRLLPQDGRPLRSRLFGWGCEDSRWCGEHDVTASGAGVPVGTWVPAAGNGAAVTPASSPAPRPLNEKRGAW
jgi:hypothetical protein